jgi:hypothetical protein
LLNTFSDASDANFTIAAPVAITTTSLPNGQVGSAYSQFVTASGGVLPYSWAVSVGTLPAGLSLNASTGEISGTPSASGPNNFTVQVTDAATATDDQALSITVDAATTLAITTTSLPNGQVGSAYSQFVTASGGVPPYSWAVYLPAVGLPPNSTTLQAVPITASTGEKPQSKVWTHAGRWWCVLPSGTGTWLKRLDGTTWTDILKLSDATNSKADVKSVGDVAHVMLFEGVASELVSVEYVSVSNTYQLWTSRPTAASVSLDSGVEIATIDIDSQGRMWVASDGSTTVTMRYSDSPYAVWSAPFTLASGVSTDDIAVVTAFPDGKIGVLWSNQTTQRFGFRTHTDGDNPTVWSADEVPASQSALNVGLGMADDHMNLAVAADGTLYAAVKTSYDTPGYPKIALLIRRPGGTWDNLYEVDQSGTRGIVLLNERSGTVSVIYTASEGFNPILHKETSTASIAFGPSATLISTSLNDCSSTKQNISGDVVILASTASSAIGVLRSTLPLGLSLNASTGEISGTPSATGTTNFTIEATDAASATDTQALSITVGATGTLAITTTSLPNGQVGSSYSQFLAATGGVTPYTWAVTVGSLPAGLSLNASTGEIFGTPSAAGPTSFTVMVTDANSATDTQGLTITVVPIASTPVGYWPMEEGSGTSIVDASGHGNHGSVLGGATWAPGQIGLALILDGVDDHAQVPNSATLDITSQITLATWVRPQQVGTQYLVKKAIQGATGGYELSLSSTGKAFFRLNQVPSGDTYRLNSLTSYPIDGTTWMHLAATYDGATLRLYVNGVQEASAAAAITIVSNTLSLGIGAQSNGTSIFRGAMDDVRVYATALSAAEIQALANPGLPTVTVLSPNGGEEFAQGTTQNITWSASDDVGVTAIDLEYSTNGGSSWIAIASGLSNSGSYPWTVPNVATSQGRVRATAHDASANIAIDISDANFAIVDVSGPVGWWPFNEGSGTTVFDVSGLGNHGTTFGGATWTAGLNSYALDLDGTDDYALVPDHSTLDLTSGITMATWIRPEVVGTQYLIKKAVMNAAGGDGYELSLSGVAPGKPFVRFNQVANGNLYRLDATQPYPTNGTTWMHVAATYDGATIKLYINGALDSSQVAVFAIAQNSLALGLGAQSDGASVYRGAMDEARLYGRALSAAEISVIANMPPVGVNPTPPTTTKLSPAMPTPFQGSTMLEYSLGAEGDVELAIFGLDGRRVRTLARGTIAAGVHRVSWDGRDDANQQVGAGMYFVRLVTPEGGFHRRLVRLR